MSARGGGRRTTASGASCDSLLFECVSSSSPLRFLGTAVEFWRELLCACADTVGGYAKTGPSFLQAASTGFPGSFSACLIAGCRGRWVEVSEGHHAAAIARQNEGPTPFRSSRLKWYLPNAFLREMRSGETALMCLPCTAADTSTTERHFHRECVNCPDLPPRHSSAGALLAFFHAADASERKHHAPLSLPVAAFVEVEEIAVGGQQPREHVFTQLRGRLAILLKHKRTSVVFLGNTSPAVANILQHSRIQTCFSCCCAHAGRRTSSTAARAPSRPACSAIGKHVSAY